MKEENGGELPERIVYVRPTQPHSLLLSTESLLILISRVSCFVFLQPCASEAAYSRVSSGVPVLSGDRSADPWICSSFLQTSTSARR